MSKRRLPDDSRWTPEEENHPVEISFQSASGEELYRTTFSLTASCRDVLQEVCEATGMDAALVLLVSDDGIVSTRWGERLDKYVYFGRTTITCVLQSPPLRYHLVGHCDACGEWRYLFNEGWARTAHGGHLEPVVAICESCGGRFYDPEASESDASDDE